MSGLNILYFQNSSTIFSFWQSVMDSIAALQLQGPRFNSDLGLQNRILPVLPLFVCYLRIKGFKVYVW